MFREDPIAAAMRQAGIREELIYAYQITGLIVGEQTPLTPERRAEWNAAIEEYRRTHN